MEIENPTIKESKLNIGLLAKMIILVLIIWILPTMYILLRLNNPLSKIAFEDLFSAVNALFSGLAFASLIYTIALQKQDLELQRNEIYLNRKELKKTNKTQKNSEKALIEQVEQMKTGSKLNALKTLINYYNLQIANPNNTTEIISKAKRRRKATIKEIETLIGRIEYDDLE